MENTCMVGCAQIARIVAATAVLAILAGSARADDAQVSEEERATFLPIPETATDVEASPTPKHVGVQVTYCLEDHTVESAARLMIDLLKAMWTKIHSAPRRSGGITLNAKACSDHSGYILVGLSAPSTKCGKGASVKLILYKLPRTGVPKGFCRKK